MSDKFVKKNRGLIHSMYGGRCAYCGLDVPINKLEADHIVPKSVGGKSRIDNFNPSCVSCNGSKNNRALNDWRLFLLPKVKKAIVTYEKKIKTGQYIGVETTSYYNRFNRLFNRKKDCLIFYFEKQLGSYE